MGYKNAKEAIANQSGFINKGSYMGNEVVEPVLGNADNIRIYVNNILMNTAKGNADAGVDLRRIPSNLIEKIEIRGNDIYITTKAPLDDTLLIQFLYGAYNTIIPKILFSKNFNNKHIVTFTANSYYTDGNYYYDFINKNNEEVIGYINDNKQLLINSSLDYIYNFENNDYIKAFVNISYSDCASQYKLPPIDKTDSWFKFTTLLSSLSYNGFSDILDYNINLSYVFDSFVDRPYFTNGKAISDYRSHAIGINASFSKMCEFNYNNITFYNKLLPEYRYEFLVEDTNTIEKNFLFKPQRHSLSIKYEPQLSFGYFDEETPIFSIIPKIKYEFQYENFNNIKNYNHYLFYDAAINLNFYKGYSLYFSYLHEYQVPTFNDLFYNNFSNPNLKPEEYNQIYTKLYLEPITNLKIEISYSYAIYTNKIVYITTTPENVDKAISHILNPSISYDIQFAKYHKIKTKLSYSYQLAYFRENKLKKIGLPENVISALLGYDFISKYKILNSLSINFTYNYYSKRPLTDYKPIYYSEEFHNFSISFYSIWLEHLIFSINFTVSGRRLR